MKKTLFLLVVSFMMLSLNAQEYVSTTPSNRSVLIEEFTGRNCGYCPDGHRIANQIAHDNPGRVWAVNIHAGGFAPTSYPNLITDVSVTIHNGFGVTSYPSGVVNRSTPSAVGRNQWPSFSSIQLQQISEVNIGGDFEIDYANRTADITVEVYYTANSSESTNYLTVIMIQDSIMGSQSGMSSNPEQIVNGQYCHMHVLRDVITPSWGEEISPTTAGTLITRNYTYEIPEMIGDPNGVEVDLDNISFIAYITEKPQGTPTRPVLNVCELGVAPPTYLVVDICDGESYHEYGFDYDTPAIGTYHDEYIDEDGNIYILTLNVHQTYTRDLSADICEGEDFNYGAFHFNNPSAGVHVQENALESIYGCDSIITMTLTVHPSYETNITAEICEGEDYKENGFNINNASAGVINEELVLETVQDCDSIINLTLTVHPQPVVEIEGATEINLGESLTLTASGADSYEWSTGQTTASITVSPTEVTTYSVIGISNGCESDEVEHTVNVFDNINENSAIKANIYPNPTNAEVMIECQNMNEITVFMPNGQTLETILVSDSKYTLNMSAYKSGIYFVRITSNNGTTLQKVVKN